MDALESIEKTLKPIFKDLPPLPKGFKDWIAKYWPIITLVLGVLQLLSAYALWHTGHSVNSLINYTNALSNAYGVGNVIHHIGVTYWISFFFILVDAIILLMAYPGLKARSRKGWNLIFLAALINLVYGIVSVFDSYFGGISQLIGALIGSAIAFYFLFQMQPYYKKDA